MIHETAIIDDSAALGMDVNIWAFSHVMEGAFVQDRCSIGQGCVIGRDVRIGADSRIQDGVLIYEGVTVEEDVFIGPGVVFTNVLNPRAFFNRMSEKKYTFVKIGATIGANSTIICGVRIGEYALVGAGSVVTRNVPDYALVVGNPARVVGKVDMDGNIL